MNATKAAPDTTLFPSPEFMQALAEKVKRQSDLKEDIKKNTHLLQLARQKDKREGFELRLEDPDARIKEFDSSLKQKEREAQRLTHEIQDLFSAEIESFNHQKQNLNINGKIVAPTNAQLHTIESTFKDAISQLITIFSGDQFGEPEIADVLERVKRLDAGIVAVNNLAREHGLPANLRINDQLLKNLATNIEVAIAKTAQSVSAELKRFEDSRKSKRTNFLDCFFPESDRKRRKIWRT